MRSRVFQNFKIGWWLEEANIAQISLNLTDMDILPQGIGWWLEEANIAQISLNLTDMDITPMHVAYEEVRS